MEHPLKRTVSNGSDQVDETVDGAPLTAVYSASSSGTSRGVPPSRQYTRSPSTHALLAANNASDVKRTSKAETCKPPASTDRNSLTMPPPTNKPSGDRRLSSSIISLRAARKSDDLARSPPNSVKSLDTSMTFVPAASPPLSTTATDSITVTTSSQSQPQISGLPVLSPPALPPHPSDLLNPVSTALPSQPSAVNSIPRTDSPLSPNNPAGQALGSSAKQEFGDGVLSQKRPRSNLPRSISSTRRLSTATQKSDVPEKPSKAQIGTVGVCALDVKARSRPSRQILTRLQGEGEFEVIVFGDKAILDEDVENWPVCDFLIAFFSDGFPLDKAIAYVKLRKPFVVNDLSMQQILWDRRLCLRILDQMHVRTPRRLEVTRDGGPKFDSAELAQHVKNMNGITLEGPPDGTGGGAPRTQNVSLSDDGDSLTIDGEVIKKPFVEKPVSGEDHNVIIYFPKSHEGGGARRLFRKVGNKSSEWDPNLIVPRCITEDDTSYIYEQFLKTENAEDVKAYTVGPDYCHAETRKSPVVDGLVRRNTHGKELRYVAKLSAHEREMASKVSRGFGQRICGFDLLRADGHSYIIDVNGWSFVKDNEDYYNDCAKILKSFFSAQKFKDEYAMVEEPVTDSSIDSGAQRSGQGHGHGHRSALKTILKSPSMTKLSAHLPLPTRHHSNPSSNKGAGPTSVPLSSPPIMERATGIGLIMPQSPLADDSSLLPTSLAAVTNGSVNVHSDTTTPNAYDQELQPVPLPSSRHSWKLKGVVSVIRHADRTPKQKVKFTAHSQVFVDLLKGHNEEVLLKGETALASVEAAVKTAQLQNLEDQDKLRGLRNALAKKGKQPGTKVQIKPMFRKRKPEETASKSMDSKLTMTSEPSIPENSEAPLTESPVIERAPSLTGEVPHLGARSDSISGATFSRFAAVENDLILDKLQLVMKWGGEPTHSARYQSADLGSNMREDLMLLNKNVLEDVRIFTSSEKRVKTSAQIWAAAFLGQQDIPEDYISVRKDLLDDSNAAKDVMDKVKKKLKHLLREGNSVPEQFAWPKDVAEPYMVMQTVVDLLRFHRKVMRHNFKKLNTGAAASLAAINVSNESKEGGKDGKELLTVASIQARWCTGEDAELFKERWEKLFAEFCDSEKADPSKVSELYDTMKYDALHNRQFLEWVFTPSQSLLDEIAKEESLLSQNASPEPERVDEPLVSTKRQDSMVSSVSKDTDKHSFAQKFGLRRKSVLTQPPSTPPLTTYEQDASYFKLFSGCGESKAKQDKRLGRLRELYRYAKILFDYVGPQEYGISDHEKLEIGLLTSLPLLREIVQDLEELQASGDAKSFIYFTKESHIYTLLNCIMEGGITTKIKRPTIPELDYLSQICFELYEAKDSDTQESTYSIRISISPGCHTIDPLDVSLDSKHAIGSAPRRTLTNHQDWKEVISTLKAKFDTVQLPKSFLAVNVSDKHEAEAEEAEAPERIEKDILGTPKIEAKA